MQQWSGYASAPDNLPTRHWTSVAPAGTGTGPAWIYAMVGVFARHVGLLRRGDARLLNGCTVFTHVPGHCRVLRVACRFHARANSTAPTRASPTQKAWWPTSKASGALGKLTPVLRRRLPHDLRQPLRWAMQDRRNHWLLSRLCPNRRRNRQLEQRIRYGA